MKIVLAIALFVFCTFGAHAVDKSWTWVNPTTYTTSSGGGTIPATGPGSLTTARLEFGTCSGTAFGTKAGEVTVQASLQRATITNILPGTVCARVFVNSTFGVESAASNVASAVVPIPVPEAPTGLTAVDAVAFEMRPNSDGTFRAVRLAILKAPTNCAPDRVVDANGVEYHRVELRDADIVNWPASTRVPPTAWARCA